MSGIVPERTELTAPYWDAAERGRLLLQECDECRAVWHPPQPLCPTCQSKQWQWIEAGGHGELLGSTVVRHAGHQALKTQLPYVLGLVRLSEGPLFVSNLTGPGDSAQTARPGRSVRLELGPTPGGLSLVHAVLVDPA